MTTNIMLKSYSFPLCPCYQLMKLPKDFALTSLLLPPSDTFMLQDLNETFCLRNLIVKNNLFLKTGVINFWLEDSIIQKTNFMHSLQQSLILRRICKMPFNYELTKASELLRFIFILIEEIEIFFSSNLLLPTSIDFFYNNYKDLYTNSFQQYLLYSEDKDFFFEHINPILYYNIINTKQLRICLTPQHLASLLKLSNNFIHKKELLLHKDYYTKNHLQSFIIIPCLPQEIIPLINFDHII